MAQLDVEVAWHSRARLCERAARGCLGIAALLGLSLAWVMLNWIGLLSEHCDFPNTCLTTWLPWAFMVTQYLWVAALSFAAIGIVAASMARWPQRDLAALGAGWIAMLLAVGIPPLHGSGGPLSMAQFAESQNFLGGFFRPGLMALVVLATSHGFATQALRSRKWSRAPLWLRVLCVLGATWCLLMVAVGVPWLAVNLTGLLLVCLGMLGLTPWLILLRRSQYRSAI